MFSKTEQDKIPAGWEWVEDVIDSAKLPYLGLPVQWDTTKEKHTKIIFDPESGETIDMVSEKHKKNKNAVGFITATKGKNPMPGSETPASVRYTRFLEPCLQDVLITSATGDSLLPCIAHGDYVKVESLESDHAQPKENILKRQLRLVAKLNEDPEFAQFLLTRSGMNKFFVNYKGIYYGTLLFYEVYFNDIDNIWLICDACNSGKSNLDVFDWFKNQWLYGEEFLDYLSKIQINDKGILIKTQSQHGLAQVAIEWFWDRHANYISVAKKMYSEIVVPLQILNMKVDHVAGMGNQVRTERLQESLLAQLIFAQNAIQAKIGMPIGSQESPHSSSDESHRLGPLTDKDGKPITVDVQMYKAAIEVASGRIPGLLQEIVKEELESASKRLKSDLSGGSSDQINPGNPPL